MKKGLDLLGERNILLTIILLILILKFIQVKLFRSYNERFIAHSFIIPVLKCFNSVKSKPVFNFCSYTFQLFLILAFILLATIIILIIIPISIIAIIVFISLLLNPVVILGMISVGKIF